jgi:O-acetyl-ADP-ribose deacetylase (regulator of RNase III)
MLGGCPPGEARLTRGYRLRAAHVIHTVGPVWQGGRAGEADTLAACYRACLTIALTNGFERIAFPAISTGIYGYPRDAAATIAVAAVNAHLRAHLTPRHVVFVCFDVATQAAYEAALTAVDG